DFALRIDIDDGTSSKLMESCTSAPAAGSTGSAFVSVCVVVFVFFVVCALTVTKLNATTTNIIFFILKYLKFNSYNICNGITVHLLQQVVSVLKPGYQVRLL